MEVKVTYELDGEIGTVEVLGDAYEVARDQAFDLVPEGAMKLHIMVDRDK